MKNNNCNHFKTLKLCLWMDMYVLELGLHVFEKDHIQTTIYSPYIRNFQNNHNLQNSNQYIHPIIYTYVYIYTYIVKYTVNVW